MIELIIQNNWLKLKAYYLNNGKLKSKRTESFMITATKSMTIWGCEPCGTKSKRNYEVGVDTCTSIL